MPSNNIEYSGGLLVLLFCPLLRASDNLNFKMDNDTAIAAGLSAAFLLLKKRKEWREKSQRTKWVKDYLKNRNVAILKELEWNDNVLFKNFTRMSKDNFNTLLEMIEPVIVKKDSRFQEAVPPEIKLAITLRYLATGDNFMYFMFLFEVSKP